MTYHSPGEVIVRLCEDAGLALPPFPPDLAPHLEEQRAWCFSTKPLVRSPYAFHDDIGEGRKDDLSDSLILAHAGHGVNSYALSYYLVQHPLRLFLQVAWDGAYTEETEAKANVNCCFALAHRLVAAVDQARQAGRFQRDERLVVAASDFYGGYWVKPGETHPSESPSLPPARPFEVLIEAAVWVERLAAC